MARDDKETNRLRSRIRRPRTVLGVAAVASIAAVAASGTTVLLAGDASNGRAPGSEPGPPIDADPPVDTLVGPAGAGRADDVVTPDPAEPRTDPAGTPSYRGRGFFFFVEPQVVVRAASQLVVLEPSDNGRGGPDPARGPNPIVVEAEAGSIDAPRSFDTDSGAPPVNPAASTSDEAEIVLDDRDGSRDSEPDRGDSDG